MVVEKENSPAITKPAPATSARYEGPRPGASSAPQSGLPERCWIVKQKHLLTNSQDGHIDENVDGEDGFSVLIAGLFVDLTFDNNVQDSEAKTRNETQDSPCDGIDPQAM